MPQSSPWDRGAAIALAATVVAAALSLYSLQPPAPVRATAPAAEFSAERALEHIRRIAQVPRPTGSAANSQVRDYLYGAFRDLGVHPQVQASVGLWRAGSLASAAIVRNIAARLPGAQSSQAVLLVGHYDSVPSGPGAGDDGHSVGVLLETLRALRSGPPLRNDVIFLFTDGEEIDMLGAAAFLNDNPWAKDAAVVLNFEARGTGGPAHMFETSEGNGWLIRQFAAAAPYPRADSVSYEVYRRMPNDTDLTVFKRHGYAGLNFAFIGDVFFYHTAFDDMAHLDPSSVQQQGSNALALARRFGNADLSHTKAPDVVYFTAPFRRVVVYGQAWVWPLAAVTLLLLAILLGQGWRGGSLTIRGTGAGLLAFLLSAMAAPAAAAGLWWAIRRFLPLPGLASIQPYNWRWMEAAFLALGLALVTAIYGWFGRRTSAAGLAAGALLAWSAVLVFTCAAVPTASFLVTWPLLASLPAFRVVLTGGRGTGLWRALSGIVAAWLLVPYVDLLFVSMTVRLGWLPMALLVLLLTLLTPVWLFAARRSVSLAFLGLCAAALAGVAWTSGFTPQHPKPVTVFYALDADSGRATWASDAITADPWIAQFIPDVRRRAPLPGFYSSVVALAQAPAPVLPLAAPEIEIENEGMVGGPDGYVRSLTLHIRSPRQAQGLLLSVTPRVAVRRFTVETRAFEPDRPGAAFPLGFFEFSGLPPEGIRCQIDLATRTALRLRVVDVSAGIPGTWQARPANVMRSIFFWPFNETTAVGRDFTIPAR
jgi:hypothetical protein